MKLITIIDMSEAIQSLIEQKLPFQLAYKISSIAEIIEKNQKFWQEKIQEIMKKYEIEGVEGIPQESAVDFNKDVQELMDVEVNADIPKLDVKELEGVELTPRHVYLLKPLITN